MEEPIGHRDRSWNQLIRSFSEVGPQFELVLLSVLLLSPQLLVFLHGHLSFYLGAICLSLLSSSSLKNELDLQEGKQQKRVQTEQQREEEGRSTEEEIKSTL